MKKIIIYLMIVYGVYALESFTGVLDNDMFLTDKWYTNGLEFKYDKYNLDKESENIKYNEKESYVLGQRIYTPKTYYLDTSNISLYDRPFAGYLYFEKTKEKYFENGEYTKKGWAAEIIGDFSLGEVTQIGYHKLLDFRKPLGWDSQIENIYGVAYIWENSPFYKNWNLSENTDLDLRFVDELHLGNVMLYGKISGFLRYGNINNPYEFKEKKNGKKLLNMDEYYLTIGSIITAKVHDSTLQGDIFNNESVFTTDIYPLVWDNKAGFYARWDDFAFYYDLIMESTDKRNLDWTDNSFRYHTLKFIFFR